MPAVHATNRDKTKMMAHQRLLLAALALISVPQAAGQSGPRGLCEADGSCPSGEFCNFSNDRVQRRNSPSCELCGSTPPHHSDGSVAQPCEVGLPPRGFTECQNVCEDTGPKSGAGGCCCGTFMGTEVQASSACAGAQMCADTDLGCCAPVFSSNGVCNEPEASNANEQCVNGSGTTGHSGYPGWDAYDCRPGVRTASSCCCDFQGFADRLVVIVGRRHKPHKFEPGERGSAYCSGYSSGYCRGYRKQTQESSQGRCGSGGTGGSGVSEISISEPSLHSTTWASCRHSRSGPGDAGGADAVPCGV